MTEAEEKLLSLVMTPEFHEKASAEMLVAMRQVAKERLPDDFEAELRAACATQRAALRAVDDLGRKHPITCYGANGLIAKIYSELG